MKWILILLALTIYANDMKQEKVSQTKRNEKKEYIGMVYFAKAPVYYSKPDKKSKKINSDTEGASKKDEYAFVVDNKNSFYQVFMKGYSRVMKINAEPTENFSAWVEASQVEFLSMSEFEKKSFQELDPKTDKLLVKAVSTYTSKFGLPLNVRYLRYLPLKTKNFGIIGFNFGYSNSSGYGESGAVSHVVKLVNSEYTIIPGNLSLYGEEIEDGDLDGDGYPELVQTIQVRTTSDAPNFFGYVNGSYISLVVDGTIDFKTKKITQNKMITDPKTSQVTFKKVIYKYKNGSLKEE
jgi:hypothetical protein